MTRSLLRPRPAAAALLLACAACGKSVYGVGSLVDPVPADSVALRLELIGDAGHPAPGEPVLTALRAELEANPDNTFVVFLGDNVYPLGFPDDGDTLRAESEEILRQQMEPLKATGVRGVMVPGNHDWQAGGPRGWWQVARQARWVDEEGDGVVSMLPDYGCPGPEVVDFPGTARLVILDTQWWLHRYAKPEGGEVCDNPTEGHVIGAVQRALAGAAERGVPAIVVGHHPMVSGGHHGGYFDWRDYLLPAHPWSRIAGFFADQDVTSERYRYLIGVMAAAFRENPPLVYAAGHEHNLQVFRRGIARYQVVSGGGIYGHITPLRAITGTRYARAASGWVRLTFLRDGRVRLAVLVVDADGRAVEDFSMWLERGDASAEEDA